MLKFQTGSHYHTSVDFIVAPSNRGEGVISERKKPFSVKLYELCAFLRVYRSIFKDVNPEPNPDTCVDSD